VVESLIGVYLELRHADERFIDTVRRVGAEPFKTRVYADRAARLEDERKVVNG
jgi:sulfite reductase (NADPH) hemoprotein beta-component